MDSERSHSTFSASVSDAGLDAHYARSRTDSEAQAASVLSDLVAIAAHLQFVAGIAVALDLALRQQNAERDHTVRPPHPASRPLEVGTRVRLFPLARQAAHSLNILEIARGYQGWARSHF